MSLPVAVVTGGSGGTGAAIATALAATGARVCLTYLTHEAKAQALAERLSNTSGQVIAVRADVGRDADVRALFAQVDRDLGPVTALVNNAGVIGAEHRVADSDADALAALWATNVTGYFLCAREGVRRMARSRGGDGGAIVNISSMAGVRGGSETRVAYGASKGAINAFTQGLAREVAAEGIRVNAVTPGYVDTDVHKEGDRPERLQRALQSVPMKRIGRPEEVADAVLWLLSEKASFVTGTLVNVAGGA
jgi:NAD(P)-dependent dehydrogenase (short-subunit alcohol dehydrogenase family)